MAWHLINLQSIAASWLGCEDPAQAQHAGKAASVAQLKTLCPAP